ncbi:capsule assembly Wzi family protein [Acinetobacter variabilis]|uniref:capsule assembly Wzi family protein n=1 Tax=Acinetobacter variabilis TaxID=70346 RepID=UPI0021D2AA0C|nr:capsule assembly Wzi family protein [Acinetobacter variabilis]MCU4311807.1 capsule assembly Wzi family protein [Acinetobacter variabilis]
MRLSKILLATLALSSSLSFAQGIVLNDQNLRTDLNWLNQQGVIQISTSTWPMSGDEIQRALSQAKISTPVQQKVMDAVLTYLNADNQLLKAALFAETDHKYLPQAFGDQEKSQYQAGLELNAGGSQWDARLRVNAEKDPQIDHDQDVNVEGSYIAGKLWNQWLIAGQIPTYWGPGHEGSLIRGDASRPVYGITAQRAEQTAFSSKWLSWIGPWQYQAFAGQLDNYDAVPDAKLIGLRVTAQPLPYLELGASRAIQWGGEGRPENFDSLWDAIIGKDNVYGDTVNPSNQIAGFDARLNLQPLVQMPLGIYAQYVGEDEAGGLPAKKMYLAGVDYSSSYQNMPYQLYSEWADTRTNGKAHGISYNHSVYTDGFYQHGYPLAHAMGGDGQMISVGGDIRFDPLNRLHGRVLFAKLNGSGRTTNAAFPEQDELTALDITWTHYLRPDIALKLNGWLGDSDLHGKDGGASIGIEFPLEKGLFSY